MAWIEGAGAGGSLLGGVQACFVPGNTFTEGIQAGVDPVQASFDFLKACFDSFSHFLKTCVYLAVKSPHGTPQYQNKDKKTDVICVKDFAHHGVLLRWRLMKDDVGLPILSRVNVKLAEIYGAAAGD